jgi:hypothetical protein
MFAVQPSTGEQDPNVCGGALGAVNGGSPAVVGMPGKVAGGQRSASATGEMLNEQPAGIIRAAANERVRR